MKRKAFISYSIKDSEQYVLTLLSNLLREEGFTIDSSFDFLDHGDSFRDIKNKIANSGLFIGLITAAGKNKYVLAEWQEAQNSNTPSLLLIEDTIELKSASSNNQNILRFNRNYPESAIEEATFKIRKSKETQVDDVSDNIVGWILGGLAILAIITLLSDD